jgi:hypothetical protein
VLGISEVSDTTGLAILFKVILRLRHFHKDALKTDARCASVP